jgi:hypothetical protein
MVKVPKASVDYSIGMDNTRCRDCRFFQAISRLCARVEGKIDPMYWCRLFKSKETR